MIFTLHQLPMPGHCKHLGIIHIGGVCTFFAAVHPLDIYSWRNFISVFLFSQISPIVLRYAFHSCAVVHRSSSMVFALLFDKKHWFAPSPPPAYVCVYRSYFNKIVKSVARIRIIFFFVIVYIGLNRMHRCRLHFIHCGVFVFPGFGFWG